MYFNLCNQCKQHCYLPCRFAKTFSVAFSPSLLFIPSTAEEVGVQYDQPLVFVGSYREGCVCILCAAQWAAGVVGLQYCYSASH